MDQKFKKLLEENNIEVNNVLELGAVEEVKISKKNGSLSVNMVLSFPCVIDVNLEKLLRVTFSNYFTNAGFSDFKLTLKYLDPNVNPELLEIYFNYILNALQKRKPRYGIISTFKRDFSDNLIKFYVGNEEDKDILSELLDDFKITFNKYGLDVEIVVEISPFEITTQTKIEEKVKQSDFEVKKSQEYYESLGITEEPQKERVYKKPKIKSGLNGKLTELCNIPASEVEVIEYTQKHGSCEFVILGEIVNSSIRTIPSKTKEKNFTIYEATISDGTDSIKIKSFVSENNAADLKFYSEKAVQGYNARVYGHASYDKYSRDVVIQIKDMQIEGRADAEKKVNVCEFKRVELHAHTKMSTQDSVLDVADYVRRASEFGYNALAVTDHANIHVLPDFHNLCTKYNIKPIFGVEGYLVDEKKFKIALTDHSRNLSDAVYVVYDIETTGLSSNYNEIIEIAACKVQYGQVIEEFSEYVKPKEKISEFITSLTSITNDDVLNASPIEVVLPRFKEFIDGCILVAHNATFDNSHIYANLKRLGLYDGPFPTIDTLQLARVCYSNKLKRFDLGAVTKFFDVELTQHHRAIYDTMATAQVFIRMLNDLLDRNIRNYDEINSLIDIDVAYKLSHPSHFTILCKNLVGKKNLYKIVSDSHTEHFFKQARVLKSFLNEHREGLLIGSSCINGDVFETAYEKSYEELKEVMSFYDYIEIQPLQLYDILDESNTVQENRSTVKKVIKTIIKCANELGKIIVATGDVHQLNQDDKEYREIYVNAPMIGGGRHPLADKKSIPSYHFRSTEEMLRDFNYLGEDKAFEYVVTNTQLIADQIESFDLFPKKLFAPNDDFLADRGIPSVAKETEKMTYQRAKELYGDPLPKLIEDRLKKELDSIIGHSFATIYYISYMLVKYSTDAGYIVGSRGSVGSSLVAYMMKITEVNSLPPHYYCPHCHFIAMKMTDDEKLKYPMDENQLKFDSILQKTGTGYDLPDDVCPICKTKLEKNGVDIPFETFLGFGGKKTPDIDLNFSGDFQAKAHEFCRTVFGEDRAFRAGTIGTIAEKTAKGYVRGYFERKGIQRRQSEIDRIGDKIQGVKRSTGQHPGGIVVLPKEIEFSDVVPIQYPADDVNAAWRTTHFDYHKFESNLLKLDILGHDDPTMIRHLMDFVEAFPNEFPFNSVEDIPLSDPEVLKIFSGLESLGLDISQTFGQSIGTTGIPEFGTSLTKDMLSEIRPNTIDSLLKISGLSHGTGVWTGNARDFMLGKKEGFDKIPFNELIGCRDDIMVYLMSKNLPAIDAFNIMESVRKGKGLSPMMEEEMISYGVPKWYIESCKLIEYMFPKAHATAYVIMALRIGWFKVHRPIFYYAGYFSRRADAFDVEVMASGYEAIKAKLVEIKAKKENKTASTKEEDTYDTLLLALEMTARGYSFEMIDIKRSAATHFLVSDDRKSLLIPFGAMDSLGESIAKSIVEAREKNMFTSKKDVLTRTKMNSTQFEKLNAMGVFGDLPQDDQIGLF